MTFIFDVADPNDLTWDQKVKFQEYMDSYFRMIIIVMSICLVIAGYANNKKRYLTIILVIILMLLTVAYAMFIITNAMRTLRRIDGYSVFNTIFYYGATIILFSLFVLFIVRIDWDDLFKHGKLHLVRAPPEPSQKQIRQDQANSLCDCAASDSPST